MAPTYSFFPQVEGKVFGRSLLPCSDMVEFVKKVEHHVYSKLILFPLGHSPLNC